jgi:hypothetical protein
MIHGEAEAFKESAYDGFLFIVVLEIESEVTQLLKDGCWMKLFT